MASVFRWGRVDHLNGCINGHLIGFAFHARHSRHPLSKGPGSLAGWIVLTGAPAHAKPLHDMVNLSVATSASQAQVERHRVFFVAVKVSHHQALDAPAEIAMPSRWPAFDSTLTQMPV
jgi:hypothetical protein